MAISVRQKLSKLQTNVVNNSHYYVDGESKDPDTLKNNALQIYKDLVEMAKLAKKSDNLIKWEGKIESLAIHSLDRLHSIAIANLESIKTAKSSTDDYDTLKGHVTRVCKVHDGMRKITKILSKYVKEEWKSMLGELKQNGTTLFNNLAAENLDRIKDDGAKESKLKIKRVEIFTEGSRYLAKSEHGIKNEKRLKKCK